MIEGIVDENGSAIVELNVSGWRGSATVPACIDTEFNGDVSLPFYIAVDLGLNLVGRADVEIGDGRVEREFTFSGVASIGGESRKVEIFVSESEDVLIGRTWFSRGSLYINYMTGAVVIEEEIEGV